MRSRTHILGFVLGLGETSCGVETLFNGCEQSKGFVTLLAQDILNRIACVRPKFQI